MYWTPFSSGAPDGSTERVRMVMNSCFIGMSITVDRWMSTPIAHQYAVGVTWLVQKAIVRTDLAGEAQDSGRTKHGFLPTVGTERKTMQRLVPFRSGPQGQIELRHALRFFLMRGPILYHIPVLKNRTGSRRPWSGYFCNTTVKSISH